MNTTIHIKPAPGSLVRDPETYETLPAKGARVEPSIYWLRRLTAGDVELMDNPPQHVGDESPPHPPNSHGKQATRLLPADSKKSVEGKK